MEAIDVLRSNLADAHWLLEETIEGLSADHVHWIPPGTANTIGATYAHVIGSEDSLVHHSNSYDWPAVKPLMAMVNGTPPAKCERSA